MVLMTVEQEKSHLTGTASALSVVKLFLQYHALGLFSFLIWKNTLRL